MSSITNADVIRNMTDEELAAWLYANQLNIVSQLWSLAKIEPIECGVHHEEILTWLKQPPEEGDNE